jgi:hypothetical protein
MIHLFYHYPCPDGVVGAMAAHFFFAASGQSVVYHPMKVFLDPFKQTDLASLSDFDEVFFIDYTGTVDFVVAIKRLVARVVILDHHESAIKDFTKAASERKDIDFSSVVFIFDVSRSGAKIASDYFAELHSNVAAIQLPGDTPTAHFLSSASAAQLRRLVDVVEDGDLWRWGLSGSKEFYAALKAANLEYDANANPSIFDALLALDIDAMVARGCGLLAQEEEAIRAAVARSFEIQIPTFGRFLAVAGDVGDIRSAVGNALAEKSRAGGLRGVGAVIYAEAELGEGRVKVSLRSIGDDDASAIAKSFGGGGHVHAASCVVDAVVAEGWGSDGR